MNVLVVDDDSALRVLLRTIIAHKAPGCEVVGEATNGLEALEKVRQLKPEIVVMDDKMPQMSGAEATSILVRDFPEIRVIGYTASSHAVRELKLAGAEAAIGKDDLDGLVEILNSAEPEDSAAS